MNFFHLTYEHHGDVVEFQPRVPIGTVEPDGIEHDTPRVCFAPTVEQCLMSASSFGTRTYEKVPPWMPDSDERVEYWHVYKLASQHKMVGPGGAYIHDVKYTDEHWVLEPCRLVRVGGVCVTWRGLTAEDPVQWWWWA